MSPENEENLKKEQNKIELLKLQLDSAVMQSEERLTLYHEEKAAHKNTRGWAVILFISLLGTLGFIALLILEQAHG